MFKSIFLVVTGLILLAATVFLMPNESLSTTDTGSNLPEPSMPEPEPEPEPEKSQELPPLPGFIPSLYSHNNGPKSDVHSNNQYRTLLQSFCESRAYSEAEPGLPSTQSGATTIYNLKYTKYKKQRDFYNSQIDWLLDCARKTGKLRVIINYYFYSSESQKKLVCESTSRSPTHALGCPDKPDGSPGYKAANVPDAMEAFDLLLGDGGPKNLDYTFAGSEQSVLAGISLSEESVSWDFERTVQDGEVKYVFSKQMRSRFLNALYDELKVKYGQGQRKFLQWYSPHRTKINYPGSSKNWPLINADGWVFDQYSMNVIGSQGRVENGDYHTFVEEMVKLEKPLYSIVWASPLRYPVAGQKGKLNFDWWETDGYEGRDSGWKSFHGQVAVNQKFGVNTLYYLHTSDPNGVLKYDVPMTQPGFTHACGLGLFEQLMTTTLPFVQSNILPLEMPSQKPGWMISTPKDCK